MGCRRRQAQALDDAVRGLAPGDLHVARIQIWNEQRRIVYSTDSALIGHGAQGEPSPELSRALQGSTASEVISDRGDVEKQNRPLVRRFGDLLEVYTPIRARGSRATVGAFELYIPYGPVAAAIAHDTHRLYLVLVIGLTVLYAVLFRLVASASRELRRRAEEAKELAERSAHDATHDPLTSLPNRSLFRDRAHQAILASARHGHNTALLLIDLDRFKEINDTLGHQAGDLLLREVGPRLHRVLRESDTVARFGGDEFGILLTHVSGPGAAEEVARAVHRALEEPFALQGLTLDVEASIGIALHPLHASDFEELMQRADVAMYRAKAKRSGYEVYVPQRGRVRRDQAEAGERAAPGAAPQRARDALPAEGRPAHGPHRRRRGAHALAPSPPRSDDARPVHPARRAQRADPLAHPLRRPDGAHARPAPGARRGSSSRCRSTSRRAT